MKKARDLTLIFFIYAIAFIAIFFFYRLLPWESFILKVIVCDIFATILVFIFSVVLKNSSVYDPYWSVAPLAIFPFFVRSFDSKTLLLLVPLAVWGIRLTLNWAKTFKDLSVQDWRYDHYRNVSGRLWPLVNFFGIHFMPTMIVIGVMLPGFLYLESGEGMNIWTAFGCLVSILGIVLEAAADATAHRFRKEHPGQVNDRGLWKYSRHPNYLGEITFWWGVFFMMLSVEPESWHFFVGPLANTLLFIFISIPLMEKRQLRNKPDYQTYREETSMLLLLPKKRKRPVTSSSRG